MFLYFYSTSTNIRYFTCIYTYIIIFLAWNQLVTANYLKWKIGHIINLNLIKISKFII